MKNKPVGDWISAPIPNFVAMQSNKGRSRNILHGHPRKPPSRPKHLRSICHTSRLIGDFVQILGSNFLALGGLNQKSKNSVAEDCELLHLSLPDAYRLARNRPQRRTLIWNREVARSCRSALIRQRRKGHTTWFHWIGHHRKPPSRPKHLRSICHTSRLIGNFVPILESKLLALGGLNQKIIIIFIILL